MPHPELELTYNIANAPLRTFAFPHLYINNIFPEDFYRGLLKNLPDPAHMKPIAEVRAIKGYKERFVMEMSEAHSGAALAGKKGVLGKPVAMDDLRAAGQHAHA